MRTVHFFVLLMVLIFQAQANAQIRGLPDCPGCGSRGGSSSNATPQGSRSAPSSSGQTARVLEAVGSYLGQAAREAAQRDSEASYPTTTHTPSAVPDAPTSGQLQWERDEAIRQQAVEETLRRLAEDQSSNPFGPNAPAVADSNSGSKGSPPAGDLSGSPCRWMVVKDAESCSSRSCFYSEGQTVAVGSSAYACRAGTWAKIRDCTQSPTAQQAKECNRDILAQHGAPGSKESAPAKVFAPD